MLEQGIVSSRVTFSCYDLLRLSLCSVDLFYLEHFSSPTTTLNEEIGGGGKGARAQRVEHHKPTELSLPLPVCTSHRWCSVCSVYLCTWPVYTYRCSVYLCTWGLCALNRWWWWWCSVYLCTSVCTCKLLRFTFRFSQTAFPRERD